MIVGFRIGPRLSVRSRATAETIGEGSFFCLYCAAERPYERRTWQQAVYLLRFWALGSRSGDFVMCLHCGSTFAPECLDENSTAEFNELLVEPPPEVADVTGLATGRGVGARTVLPGVERRLSGYSAGRRH